MKRPGKPSSSGFLSVLRSIFTHLLPFSGRKSSSTVTAYYDTESDTDSVTLCEDSVKFIPGPITRLPTPLLTEIFLYGKQSSDTAPFELTISHVDSRWRYIACSSPALWTHINTAHGPGQQLESLQTYLERAAGQLLDIRLSLSYAFWNSSGPAFLSVLETHAFQWRSLSIQLECSEAIDILRSRFRDLCVPHLEHLSILCLDEPVLPCSIGSLDFSSSIFCLGVPKLATLRLQNGGMTTLRPPLNGITTLYVEDFNHAPMQFDRFVVMIKSLPFLAHLSIYGDFVTFWPDSLSIFIPSLQTLRVAHHNNLASLLRLLEVPNLESLTLKAISTRELWKLWGSQTFTSGRHFPNLRHLCLNDACSSDAHLNKLFSCFPSVTHLELVNYDANEALFVLSQQSIPRSNWLPQLNMLTLHSLREEKVVDPTFLLRCIVEQRSIRHLRLHSSLLRHIQDIDSLKPLCSVSDWARLKWPPHTNDHDDDDMLLRLTDAK